MRLDFWNRTKRDFKVTITVEDAAPDVSRTSPARLLANSLTDPETRGEWESKESPFRSIYSHSTVYRNKARDLTISRWWSLYGKGSVNTPFTLSEAEQKLVEQALTAFERHLADVREAEALARLTAPREGLKPDRGETPKSGSTAKRRKPGPKGRAQNTPNTLREEQ